jgi:hypothetical protein
MQEFVDDDEGYYAWIAEHPDGYVLNIGVHPNTYPGRYNQVLHCATCYHVARRIPNRTGPDWKKMCSDDRSDLIRYGERREGAVPTFCLTCQP